MTVKEKLAELKQKAKENRTVIVAVVSAGIAVGASLYYSKTSNSLQEALLQEVRDGSECREKTPFLHISDDNLDYLKADPEHAAIFEINGDQYHIMHCTDEH